MCRTLGRVLVVWTLFALILPGLIPVVMLAPTSEVMTVETIGNAQLSISSHIMTSREVEGFNSSIGVRQDGTNYNILIDGHGTGLAPPSSEELVGMVGNTSVTDSVTLVGLSATSSYDISTQPYFPIVGDQGSQGSCAAWALTYYAYGYEEAKDNGWTDATTGNVAHLMSPAWTYNMVDGGSGAGTFMDTNAAIITSWGVATLATDPYVVSDVSSWGSQAAFLEAPLHRALSYSTLTYDSTTTISSIRSLIAANTPVTFAMDAGQFVSGLNDNNLIVASEYTTGSMNHAQCIVGYDDSKTQAGSSDVGAFKVVNSWGTGFGDKGYYWISYDTIKKIGASGLLYATYITDRASYQPSLLASWQFSTAPTRDSAIAVGIGVVGSTTKVTPFFTTNDASATVKFPTYMALDISSLSTTSASGTNSFYLTIGKTNTAGVISSFKVQQYLNGYASAATSVSGQSPNVPLANPCSVTVSMTGSSGTTTAPSSPTAVSASSGSSSITIGWSVPTNTGGSAITGYRIYRSTTSTKETLFTSTSSTVRSYTDANVASGTTYYYQLAAINSVGTSGLSAEVSGKIISTAPSMPSGLTATAGTSYISLSWTYGGKNMTGFKVFRGTVSGGEIQLAMVSSSVLTYKDSSATAGVKYYYYVKSYNSLSDSTPSAEVSAIILTVSGAPTALTATASGSYVSLSWTAPSSNGGSAITSYSIYRGTAAGSESTSPVGTSTTLAYTDSTIVVGTTYYYVVKATNSIGTSLASNEASYKVGSLPSPPTNLLASQSLGKVTISWAAPSSSGSSAITGYLVYRGISTVLTDQVQIASVTSTSYQDTTVTIGTTYYYTVKAVNSVGSSASSASLSVLALGLPDIPGNLIVTGSSNSLGLSWTAPSNNGGSAITSYSIYRGTAAGSESTSPVGTSTTLAYNDSTIVVGTTYYYVVKATNSIGTSLASNEASNKIGSVPSAPNDLIANQALCNITVSWTAPSSSGSSPVTGYTVYRGTSSALTDQVPIASVAATSSTDTSVTSGTTYYYTVRAVNSVGSSSSSALLSVLAWGPPDMPGSLIATASDTTVALSWTAPTSNGGSAINGYNVYRSTASGSETLLVSLGVVSAYNDSGLTNGNAYYYRITAVNLMGESIQCPERSAIPIAVVGVPGAFTLNAIASDSYVSLSWTIPEAGVSSMIRFEVLRNDTLVENVIASLNSTSNIFVDKTVISGKDYTYRIIAYNSEGSTSSPSASVQTFGLSNLHLLDDTGGSIVPVNKNNDRSQYPIWAIMFLAIIGGVICSVYLLRSRRGRS